MRWRCCGSLVAHSPALAQRPEQPPARWSECLPDHRVADISHWRRDRVSGAEQLRKFGTNILSWTSWGSHCCSEIAPLIAAILIAGRSGSAYAAHIGTMKVTEELDALRTFGLSPTELLVLPRMLALIVAPAVVDRLCRCAGCVRRDVDRRESAQRQLYGFFWRDSREAVALRHFLIGVGKAPFLPSSLRWSDVIRDSRFVAVDDVGRHTTMSVVQKHLSGHHFDALCSIILNWWNL